ncbi:MAG: cobalamin B12-binding domain-containing protein [Candidatus Helarchaeota archaeon]|nr:cobalamin B12-binding domain-containing protein [Candidatus Helarchaeota archaeon]
MPDELATDLADLERDKIYKAVKKRAEAGENPLQILGECRQGMKIVGDRFQAGEYFLSDMIIAAQIFDEVASILEPYLANAGPAETIGKVVLATLKGDIHDLGKNIFATLLNANGFEVHDIGVDVDPVILVNKVKEVQPDIVGFSALITSAFSSMKEAVDLLEEKGLRSQIKLIVGGGLTTPAVKEYIGADFQTTDANEGALFCKEVMGGSKNVTQITATYDT